MLSKEDYKNKKIVYITNYTEKKSLKYSNDNLVVYKDNKIASKVSLHITFCVVFIGDLTITSYLIRKLVSHGVSVLFLNKNLKQYAVINSKSEGNYILRQSQYLMTEQKQLELSKFVLANKIKNQASLLTYYKKPNNLSLELKQSLKNAKNFNDLLGLEGSYASSYFKSIFTEYGWYKRSPMEKNDFINLLMDVGYTLTFNYIDFLLSIFGFDTYKGFYHRLFFQRKSLVCDVQEPFRVIVDKAIVKAINLKIYDAKDFKVKQSVCMFKDYKASEKYMDFFIKEIFLHKMDFYAYVSGLYKFYMYSQKYKFPVFNLKKH